MSTVHNLGSLFLQAGSLSSTNRVGDDLNSTELGRSSVHAVILPRSGQLRSRKVVSRSNARSTGKHPSWKLGRMVHWESRHELNAFRLLDCDPDVTYFSEQPCQVVYVMDGVEKVHYPDLLVTATDGKELWEVKPLLTALDPEALARTALLSRDLPKWGYEYRTVFGEDLAAQPRLSNANLLLRFGTRVVGDCEWEDIRRAVDRRGRLIWSEACRGDYGAKGCEILCGLVLRGILAIDMNSPVSPNTHFVAKREL